MDKEERKHERKHERSVLARNKGFDHFCLLSAIFWSAELLGCGNFIALRDLDGNSGSPRH